jgi:para-aminobenzoate synthetase/4-amino-4-deoxychorismate lyase
MGRAARNRRVTRIPAIKTVNARAGPTDQQVVKIEGPSPEPARGVFETMLVLQGRPVELGAHLARIEASLGELYGLPLPADAPNLVLAAAGETELGRLRLDVSPQDGSGVRVADVDPSLVFPSFEHGVELLAVSVPGGIGAHKWADRRLLEQAEREAGEGVPLVVDADGTLLEGSRGSLFLVSGGVLSTPPADGRLLPGITRARVIEIARAAGIEVREEELAFERLVEADEVFLTGAVRGIEPVRAARGLREWVGGELTGRISAQLRTLWFG